MNQLNIRSILLILLALSTLGCAWKPDVTAEPITAPWSEMKLPVEKDAVVFRSEPAEFRAAHKGDASTVSALYVEALKAQGWEMFDYKPGEEVTATFKKANDELSMRAYFFDGSSTAVVLEKPAPTAAPTP